MNPRVVQDATAEIDKAYVEMRKLKEQLYANVMPKQDMSPEDRTWRRVMQNEVTELYDKIQRLKDIRHLAYQEK